MPQFCTTVYPDEYNIDQQMRSMVRQSNVFAQTELLMDVGKVWGLYLAYKELKKRSKK